MIFNQSVAQSVFPLQMVRSRMRRRRGVLQALQASRKRKASDAVLNIINACPFESRRMTALHQYMKKEIAVKEKEKEIAVKEKEKEIAVKEKEKEIAVLQKENQLLNRGLLQVQGLLTSRGLLERVAQLAFDEQVQANHMRGKFNCSDTLKQVPKTGEAGHWSRLLRDTIKQCAPQARTKEASVKELVAVRGDLSKAIHGQPWHGPDVKMVSALSQCGQCVIRRLATELGLEMRETEIDPA